MLAVLVAASGVLGLWCEAASAGLAHPYVSSFGSFASVQGVAVASSSGDVYVYDGGEGKVLKFDASGIPVEFTSTKTNAILGAGSASNDEGQIAVDNSSGPAKGDIYVAHAGGSVEIYSAVGEKIGELTEEVGDPWGEACGVAVDASGNVYVGLYESHINKYVPTANPVTNSDYASSISSLNGVCNVTADSTGNAFSDIWPSGPVTRYESGQFGALFGMGSTVDTTGSTLAVDPDNDELYVDERNQISQFGVHGEPFQEPVSVFGSAGAGSISGSLGIAVSGFNHDVYVADGQGAISVFGPAVAVPEATTGIGSDVQVTSATLNGTVNPEGVPVTACEFEYGTTTAYGQSAPCVESVGSGTSPVAVHAEVNGLTEGTTYHFRLLASNAGGSNEGADGTFGTPGPPTVSGEGFSEVTFTTATVNANVDPSNIATTYHVEYGTSESYDQSTAESEPVDQDGNEHTVTAHLAGLQPGTTYHFRFVAQNTSGGTNGPDETFSTYLSAQSALPDGRVYEEVSPSNKKGSSAGVGVSWASADGNAVVYNGQGFGTATSGRFTMFVSKRTPAHGWQTVSTTPHPTGLGANFPGPTEMVPSSDFDRFLFTAQETFMAEDAEGGLNVYLSENPISEPEWIGRPRIANPLPGPGGLEPFDYTLAGASPSLSTVYFTYPGTLVPEDASRAANVASSGVTGPTDPWGFYEWSDGKLVNAGVLPDGNIDPYGAVPASDAGIPSGINDRHFLRQTEAFDNQVSEDGSRAFFVSPDPSASGACTPCSSEPPELYVREPGSAGKVSVLISASKLAGHKGEAAPTGVVSMPDGHVELGGTDIYASPDGSQAFFASKDQLTATAPSNGEVKVYDYDLESGELTYVPGVTPPLVQASHDGSQVLFENTTTTPAQLELWRSGPDGGGVTAIAELVHGGEIINGKPTVNEAHFSESDSVVVFRTDAQATGTEAQSSGGFNDGGFDQIYRYEEASDKLDCLSCPPRGLTTSGNVHMSQNDNNNEPFEAFRGNGGEPTSTIEARGMAQDGSRVFFDTPDPLVPQDVNGVRDVYEWENGVVYLISSGASSEEAFYLDNDDTGENVFFKTAAGMVPGDADGGSDVYDARMPRPGDNPQGATPCKGSVCQGPPSVPQLLGQPASETFSGEGNVAQAPAIAPAAKSKSKSLTRAQRLARALKVCKQQPRKKRAACKAQARKRYEPEKKSKPKAKPKAKATNASGAGNRHHNGRGK
jgi:hypothetical protein